MKIQDFFFWIVLGTIVQGGLLWGQAPPVTNPEVWLRGDLGIVTDGSGLIERWEDQSGNANHFEQTDGTKRPALAPNGFVVGGGVLNEIPRNSNGNSNWGGTLATDFVIEEEVQVTELAVFDQNQDGLSETITVALWQRLENGTPSVFEDDLEGAILVQLDFTTVSPGTLDGNRRWKTLTSPVTLAPGSYTLGAWGYGGQRYHFYNNTTPSPTSPVRRVGWGRFSDTTAPGAWPNNRGSGSSSDRYAGAVDMRYEVTGTATLPRPAVRFDGVNDGLQAVDSLALGRPGSVFVVYRRDWNDTGYIMQNTTGNHWYLDSNTAYAQGTIREQDRDWRNPWYAEMQNQAGGTRFGVNGEDWTYFETFNNANPGRLAIGGGAGRSNSPLAVRVAEVLAYDRQLTDSERWLVNDYLAERYGFATLPVATPVISPASSIGSGSVSVSITAATPSVEIRYTTDGSEPNSSSTLYASPFSIARGVEVKAKGFLAGSPDSGVAARYYEDSSASEIPVSGSSMWLRADRGVELDSYGKVARWQDLSGNGRDMTQGTVYQRPELDPNGVTLGQGLAVQPSTKSSSAANSFGGTLGMDFVVTEEIEVTDLRAFDHLGDGFATPVTVAIWVRDDGGTAATPEDDLPGTSLVEVEFSAADPGTLGEFSQRVKTLPSPLVLAPGSYTLLGWGFTNGNNYHNGTNGSWPLDKGIEFVNRSRYGNGLGTWPTILDSDEVKYHSSSNFRFNRTSGTVASRPTVTFDGTDDGLWALPATDFDNPATVFVVYDRQGTDAGYVMQSSPGQNWWFLRNDGAYNFNNWVQNRAIPRTRVTIAGMSSDSSGTRFYVDGDDWTERPGQVGAPGRLTLGGGVGRTIDPLWVKIAEVVAFDRVLDANEHLKVENWLRTRYLDEGAIGPDVVFSPEGDFGTGSVSVELSSISGSEIRYTLDGSEPTLGSTLYSGAITVPRDTKVRARAWLNGVGGTMNDEFYGDSGAIELPVAGANLWVRGDCGLTLDEDGLVKAWKDLTGNGNDFLQEIPELRPRLEESGLNASERGAIQATDSVGNGLYPGSLGNDLSVTSSIEVTHLGAFDHLGDGFNGTITVEIWSRNDNGTTVRSDDTGGTMLASETFTRASPGTLVGRQQRFKALASPLTLAPGEYTVFAWGYVGGDRYRESRGSSQINDNRFSFPTCVYNGVAGAFPTAIDSSGPLDYNGVANFRVTPASPAPSVPAVVFDGVNDAIHGVDTMNFGRPSTVFTVFEIDRDESGDVIQNTSGSAWALDSRGFYVGNWVRLEDFDIKQATLATMVNGVDYTEAWRNGKNVTTNGNLFSASPGRLIMGGGENGVSVDPLPVRISEVIVFDRVLDEGELNVMSNYLAARNGLYLPRAEVPEIGPFANYGSGPVEVNLSSVTPGAELRYTIDGSEPTESSLLYSGPFNVPRGTLVRARAFGPGLQASTISETFFGDESQHPLPVTDPAMWLWADVGVEEGVNGGVERWRDLSGNGNDVVQVSDVRAPQKIEGQFGGNGQSRILAPNPNVSATSAYNGFLASDFQVDYPIEVTHLGAFDAGGDGIAGSITVKLFETDDGGTPGNSTADRSDDTLVNLLGELTFTSANPGVLDQGIRLLPLSSPLTLQPGIYTLYATGYTGADTYRSQDFGNQPVGFGVTTLNRSRFSSAEASLFPGSAVNDDRYLMMANCRFQPVGFGASSTANDAVRFDGSNDGLLGSVDFSVERPSTVFMVFDQLSSSQGRLLQSASGSNYLLGPHGGTQGLYAEGWVAQRPVSPNQPALVIGEQGSDYSRYFYAGSEFTQEPNFTGNLGRVALGGGEGVYFQPTNADLAELVIYDRVLSPSERQSVAQALSSKHGLAPQPLPVPEMTPDGGLYSTAQTVTISSPIAGSEIRYTLDGSEPNASSTLYTGSLTIGADTVVKARSYAAGFLAGPVQTGVFFIDSGAPVPPARSTMELWLRAAKGVEGNGSDVTLWRDLSGRGADATVVGSSNVPQLNATAIGGAPGVVFDGVDDYLRLEPGFDGFGSGHTAIFVTNPDESLSNWERLIDFGRATNVDNLFFGRNATTTDFVLGTRSGSSAGGLGAIDAFRSLTDQILTVVQNSDGRTRIYRNGNLEVESPSILLPRDILRTRNYVGRSNWTSDAYFSGAISEVILFDGALDDFEREVFEDQIRATYGIASSATGTVGFSPDSAPLYPAGVSVVLQSATPGAAIHYTLDGSIPDEASPLYSGPIALTQSARVRARAFFVGLNPSNLSETTYLVGDPPSGGDGLLATYYNNDDFTGSTLVRVDPNVDFSWGSGSPDPSIDPDSFSVRWTGKVVPRFTEDYVFSTFDDGARLWVDLNQNGIFEDATELLIDELTSSSLVQRFAAPVSLVAGELYDMQLEYQENVSSAQISFRWESFSEPFAAVPQSQLFSDAEFNQTVVTPVISPVGGTYNMAVDVTIETSTPGATLYYTIDGTIPDDGSAVYTGSFVVPEDTVVRAIAYKAGFNPSGVSSQTYDIDAQPPTITSFAWDGSELLGGETFVASGQLSAEATDNQGVASAEFYYQPAGFSNQVLIGRDTSPSNGLTANWNVASVPDGSYDLIVRVFDTAGTFSEVTESIDVSLVSLAAPVISQPATGLEIEVPTVTIRVDTSPSANVRILRDGTLVFAGYANSGGVLNYVASVPVGTSAFTATAVNRAGASPVSNSVSVTRVREFPQLTLSFPSDTLAEGAPLLGSVSIPVAVAEDVSVSVSTNRAAEVEAVSTVTILAGATSADFTLTAIQDARVEAMNTVTVTATALNHRDDAEQLMLIDDDTPVLSLVIDETTVAEDFGAVTAKIVRAQTSGLSQRVYLSNTAPDQATVPGFVTIPAGQTEIGFTIAVIDDELADGNQFVEIQGTVEASNQVVSSTTVEMLEVRDNEGPSLSLISSASLLNEGSISSFTLRRSGIATTGSLTVNLEQTPVGEVTAPATVTFPANVSEIPVSVTALNSTTAGTRTVILRATASGYTDGLARFSVTDVVGPDFAPDQLVAPLTAKSEKSIPISYRVRNLGLEGTEDTPFLERVYLSNDPSPSDDDVIVRQVEQDGDVTAGGSYLRNLSIFTPREVGEYYVIVTVDAGNAVDEVLESNNTVVRAIPLQVEPAYSVVVQAAETIIPANTPIEFTGSATTSEGLDVAFSMVNIHIGLGDTERVISAFTDSVGNFSTTWTPLPNEGGSYTIGATHPGTDSAPVQDTFDILAIGFDRPPSVRLDEGESVIVQTTLTNPNTQDLTGVSLDVVSDLPAGLTITPMLPSITIPAGQEMVVPITVSASNGFSGSGLFGLEVTTAEGVLRAQGISIQADLLVPVLTLDPSSLNCSVLRGSTKTASFEVTNTGGLETGAIQVLLPDVPWMTLVSSNPISSLAPGESTEVNLQLSPTSTVDLTLFTGNLALNAENGGSRNINYRFRVVSDLMGDLDVTVVDEAFYFTDEAPALEGAQVRVRDAITSQLIAEFTTGVDGLASFPDLMEGWYRVEVTADQHDRYSNNVFVNAGVTNEELVFISKQLVNYTWTVEEVEIEDTYRITIETTFETNVPAPVVTLAPAVLDVEDLQVLGQQKVVNVTITNHGFIDAQNSEFDFSEHPFYTFTPLITNVGTIPAKSSLVIPVTICRIGTFDSEGNIVTIDKSGNKSVQVAKKKKGGKAASVPCGAGGSLCWYFPCGPNDVGKKTNVGVSGVVGNCSGSGTGGRGYIGFHGGYYRGGGNTNGGGDGTSSGSSQAFSSFDPCCPCLARAGIECIIGFVPGLGCIYGTMKCVSSTVSSLGGSAGSSVFGTEGDSTGDAVKNCVYAILGCFPPTSTAASVASCLEGLTCCSGGGAGGGGGGGGGAGGGGGSGGPPGFPIGKSAGSGTSGKASLDNRKGAKNGNTPNEILESQLGTPWYEFIVAELREGTPELEAAMEGLETYLDLLAVTLGSRERVLYTMSPEGEAWLEAFGSATNPSSEDGRIISGNELTQLAALAGAIPDGDVELGLAAERWNRSVAYGAMGIFADEDVPSGDSLDFIPGELFLMAAEAGATKYDESLEAGFLDPMEQLFDAYDGFQEELLSDQGGTCARVKIEISQDLMLTRTAFEATLQLENEREDAEVTNVGFDLQIRDLSGEPSEDLFNIQVSKLENLGAIDGSGSIPVDSSGTVQWTLIPRDTAALTEERQYTVGGVITFTQDELDYTIPVENMPITVRPDASLTLKYFHQRDVYSDDPYTDAIEPAIPYKLAVLVENSGYGAARDLKIISGQPEIVENEKGLFIDFKIIATQVDGQPVTPSLTADFGDLAAQDSAIATWFLTSTLQGLFIDYDATFEHVTGMGDSRISLLQSVEIHETIRFIDAKDGSQAFLTNDVSDVNDYPDTIHFEDGEIELVTVSESAAITGALGAGNFEVTLDTGSFTGWNYIRVPDPGDGDYKLVGVTRSDGEVLRLDFNAWTSDRTFIGQGRRPRYEDILHLVDCDSTGVYTLTYEVNPDADSTPPTSMVTSLPANSPKDIPVFWSGSDDTGVALYDVFVSSNGGPWAQWKDNTAELGAVYPGTVGETYSFYSIAIDVAGNNEVKVPIEEATTEVVDSNLPPVIASIPDQSITEGTTFSLQAFASDPDGANADIRFSVGSAATGVTIDPLTGVLRWVTSETTGGSSVNVIVVARDASDPAGVANEEFTITVQDVNSAPTISSVGPQTLQQGGMLIVDVDSADGDVPVQTLTYSLGADSPAGASVDPSSGVVTWVPSAAQADQSHVISVIATDNGSPSRMAQSSFSVTVIGVDDDLPPVFGTIPVLLWLEGQSYSFDVMAVDPNGDAITLGANVSGAPGATFADLGGGAGRVVWDTTGVASSVYQIPLTASANGLSTNGQLVIQVEQDSLYWSWVEETFGSEIPAGLTAADIAEDGDPDGDLRTNVHEMAWLTDPMKTDQPKVDIELVEQGAFRLVRVGVHRRTGSDEYVEMVPMRNNSLEGAWQDIPGFDWSAIIDGMGDEDGREETESVDFSIFEFDPNGLPEHYFFQVESREVEP